MDLDSRALRREQAAALAFRVRRVEVWATVTRATFIPDMHRYRLHDRSPFHDGS